MPGNGKFLTKSEEAALIREAQRKDVGIGPTVEAASRLAARNTLVERNIRLIWDEAIRFAKRRGCHCSKEFLGTACEAYLKAIAKFDLSRGFRLSTYAIRSIRHTLIREYQDNRYILRVPSTAQNGKGTPHLQELARLAMFGGRSLHDSAGDGHGTFGDMIPNREPQGSSMPGLALVLEYAERLPERWEFIVKRRIDGATLDVIGKELSVTKERVRQLETAAINKLREWLQPIADDMATTD